jgi:hypothetical protein
MLSANHGGTPRGNRILSKKKRRFRKGSGVWIDHDT